MLLRTLFFALPLAVFCASVDAASNFNCDPNKSVCTCNVTVRGDCDAMKKNCESGKIDWCIPGTTRCACTLNSALVRGGQSLPQAKTLAPQTPAVRR